MMCFEEWRNCILSNCGHYYSSPLRGGHGGMGDFQLRRRFGIDIAEIECRIDRIDRQREGIRRDDNEYLFLLVQKSGETILVHDGHEEALTAGDCVLMDSTRPAELRYEGRAASFTSVHLPRGLCLEGRTAAPVAGRRVGKSHPLRPSLLALLSPSDSDESVEISGDYLFDFVALMFRSEAPVGDATRFRDRHGRFHYIRGMVERHLRDPEFSIEQLASLVHMSRRQVQRDFSDNGTSFTRFLSDRRAKLTASHLRRAAQMNERPAIAELAFRVGFSELSHFNRVFRASYGMSPSDYHANCVEIVSDR
ncbi:helix-turn-helix domain-containing protein [Amaricoccus solimangrovi]|uniref:Helix-turn-helix domain-containing protein n=1 Tax=Amaricoccus solimangrovi TaxID=2589815 RepID=A0A501X180_9RHOB|nr:helix-turn-helix domain-containing protein [Amaricoccus solimangrovi]TPE53266.1 helix-turn-helix domain-containing protein [Amaricoccus solimangrovi]